VYSDAEQEIACDALVAITSRLPNDELQQALQAREHEWRDAGIDAVTAIGDCLAPGLIAHAVYAGHRFAQELEEPMEGEVHFQRHFPAPTAR
jgi:dimethylamine/trimethylamine dehydrogenase